MNEPVRYAGSIEGVVGPLRGEATTPRILVCIPSTGVVRFEWAMQMMQFIIPVNWSQSMMTPYIHMYGPQGFHVAQARNLCVGAALDKGFEWIFFLDHDVIPPADLLVRLNLYVQSKKYPIVSGLYYQKGIPSYPLVFRGRGNGVYMDWKRGDLVKCDGVPMGCTLIHTDVFRHLPKCKITDGTGGEGWYDSPRFVAEDPETMTFRREVGTEDLHICNRIIEQNILAKAGWEEFEDDPNPFLVDTNIWCTHIAGNGQCYPPEPPEIGESPAKVLEEAF